MTEHAGPPPGWQQPPPGWQPAPPTSPDLGLAFKGSWQAFRDHLATLLVAGGVLFVVTFLPLALLIPLWWEVVTTEGTETPDVGATQVVLALLALPVMALVVPIFQSNLTRICLSILDGQEPGTFAILRFKRLGGTIGAEILIGLGALVGFLLCVLPGIVFSWAAGFTYQLLHDRDLGPLEALKASVAFVRRNLGWALVTILLGGLVASTGAYVCYIGMIASAPFGQLFTCHLYRQISALEQS